MARSTLVSLLLFSALVGAFANSLAEPHWGPRDDTTKWTVEFVQKHGYTIETHEVSTEDGYLLDLHRIPSKGGKGKPILLHHGFLGRSADFVVLGPKTSLAFILADRGFDVWMANARGSTNSRKHVNMTARDSAFWDFSWHEIGMYDIPAEIDYILEKTEQQNLTFIGFSMGTSAFFVMASTKPEYNQKVNQMIALGPVSFMEHVRGPVLRYISPMLARMPWVLGILGNGEFLPTNRFMTWAAQKFCQDDTYSQKLCKNALFLFYGYNNPNMNGMLVDRIFEYSPSGGSTKEFLHFAQLVKSAPTFRMYDYGLIRNLARYGKRSPPEYDLAAISTPVHLFMGANDWFADKNDVMRLSLKIKNTPTVKLVKRENFNHFDFVYAEDLKELVYDDVLSILEK